MSGAVLLDTCAAIWVAEGLPISQTARDRLDSASEVFVSPMSAWEVGMLVSRGRLSLTSSPLRWWDTFVARGGLELAPMPPALLLASNQLPGDPPKDPSDRIIAATARELDAQLMTRDRLLLDYGAAGHVRIIAC